MANSLAFRTYEMTQSKRTATITRIIACDVFRAALDCLKLKDRYPNLRITYLPGRLHLNPAELKKCLMREVRKAQRRGDRIICLYGDCFPDIGHFCEQHGIMKVTGYSCHEFFLGSKRFKKLLDDVTGTYFIEEGLITNFEDYCMKPLELHDEEMRRQFFQHYKRLLYVRQPSDPELLSKASEIAQLLELSLEVEDTDYSCLEEELLKLL